MQFMHRNRSRMHTRIHVRGFDGDASLLFVLAGVRDAIADPAYRYDPSLAHERVGERGLAVVHVRNYGHVADVAALIHDGADL